MLAALQPGLKAARASVQVVDIDTDPGLKARYGWDVPLLFDGEREICRHEFDPAAFAAWLIRP
jgi:hypothetical protein